MKSNNKFFLLIAAILFFTTALRAQGSEHKIANELSNSTTGNTNSLGSFNRTENEEKAGTVKWNLLRQLDNARTSNNVADKQRIEESLNKINGTADVNLIEMNDVTGGPVSRVNKNINGGEHDFLMSQITNTTVLSSATATVASGLPNSGTIYVATTVYNPNGGDTCKIFSSSDGGTTWNYSYYFNFSTNSHFRTGELDIELVYDGTNMWIYGTAGFNYTVTNQVESILFRFNTTTNNFNGYTLLWPGSSNQANKYYNPRITSDNSNYTLTSYVYVACSFDSTYAVSLHYAAQKYAHVTNPFAASPTINFNQPNSSGSFYWNTNNLPANTYVWSDIAYFKTQGNSDRIITVYSVQSMGSHNLFTAWSDNYGATLTGSDVLTDANTNFGARIAFNGGANNYNGMIVYVRQNSGNIWDPYCRSTTDGGLTWNSAIINQSTSRTRSIDVIAVRGGANLFKVAFTRDSSAGTFGYYTGGNSNSWNQPAPHTVTPPGADTSNAKVIAGYKNAGGDDCFAVYSLGQGTNLYGSTACQSTLGITNNNNGIPNKYSLDQNYPNPFNPSTKITFSLPQNSFVKLVVFDITGKEYSELVNQQLNAGNYTYEFNAASLASGVYFYTLEAGDFRETKKMLLVK